MNTVSKIDLTKYIQYRQLNDNDIIKWINKKVSKQIIKFGENQQQIEHLLDFFIDSKPQKIQKISYKDALIKAKKWQDDLNKKAEEITEEKTDTEVVLDFKDGYKIVKLIHDRAYKREGFLMSHCVGSYSEKNDDIFSLRDSKNNPHATFSKSSQQIKGKGNGSIHPKYIKYCVEFLEYLGLEVRDSEMKNLGYVNVSTFSHLLTNDLFRGKYIYKSEKLNTTEGYVVVDNITTLLEYTGDDKIIYNGNLYVRNYGFALPDALSHVGGNLYVENYGFALPDALSHVGGSLDVRNYGFKLPDALSHVGGYLDVRNYGFALPANLISVNNRDVKVIEGKLVYLD